MVDVCRASEEATQILVPAICARLPLLDEPTKDGIDRCSDWLRSYWLLALFALACVGRGGWAALAREQHRFGGAALSIAASHGLNYETELLCEIVDRCSHPIDCLSVWHYATNCALSDAHASSERPSQPQPPHAVVKLLRLLVAQLSTRDE